MLNREDTKKIESDPESEKTCSNPKQRFMEPPDKLPMPDTACGKMVLSAQLFRTRKPDEYKYGKFHGSSTDNMIGPMTQIHNITENKVTFKSIIMYPDSQLFPDLFNKHKQAAEMTELYTRGVFITDDFMDMIPSYLSFFKGVVDSDDLPLNVPREILQQHKLLKVIKKTLVVKTLNMIK